MTKTGPGTECEIVPSRLERPPRPWMPVPSGPVRRDEEPFATPALSGAGPGGEVPRCVLGGMPIACLSRIETAELILDVVAGRRQVGGHPLYLTSANGQVISEVARDAQVRRLFEQADLISADGQPMVLWSKLFARRAVPDRCATTDLYHDVSALAPPGTRYFLLGASRAEVEEAVRTTRRLYPHITIAGHADGYYPPAQEPALVARIDAAAPDILWIGMGVPREQEFVVRHRAGLTGVKVIKTSGGLFNFLSGSRSRAPALMQAAGLEWLWRLFLEPRRLFRRYLVTNCHSLILLMTRTR